MAAALRAARRPHGHPVVRAATLPRTLLQSLTVRAASLLAQGPASGISFNAVFSTHKRLPELVDLTDEELR
jgi:hypothetical protein